ncbi:MAG: hypothetical protein DMF69_21335 [Acidobacteria bacterium]|nr:MAG: hypothetical protein DMF69_21335 [Acidobacteriota bacterium]
MINFLVPAAHSNGIRDYLDVHGASMRNDFRIVHCEDLAHQKEFARGTYVLAALDQLTPGLAGLLLEIYRQLKDLQGFRFINNPETTLQRFDLLNELSRRGLNEFRPVRAAADEGALSPLLNSESEVQQAIGKALVQGHKLKELLIIEFCETADETGYYSKYGAFVVGKRILPRSLNYGKDWMLKHSQTEFSLPMVHEELDYMQTNPHEQQLREIFDLAHVDYGRIDYSIKNGRVQTWEINLNPTIGRGLRPSTMKLAPDVDAVRAEGRKYFFQRFETAWKEVELFNDSEPAVELKVRSEIREAARMSEVDEQRLLTATRAILRPVKPLIEPLSLPFLRALGWLARLNQSPN